MKARRSSIQDASLREMLADSIVQAVMSRDGVTEQDVAAAVSRARHQLAAGRERRANTAANIPASLPALAGGIWSKWASEEGNPRWKH